MVITIVVYTWLRARHGTRQISRLPARWSARGLMAFAVADSGFTIQTTAEVYSSGNVIDLGWFLGFALILLAALRRTPRAQAGAEDDDLPTRPIGNLLPYIAVTVALLTSAVEVLRTGHADVVRLVGAHAASWCCSSCARC